MRQLLFLVVILVISTKTLLIFLGGPVALERDSLGYWNLSTSVMQGDILLTSEPIAYRTPVYPWFLAFGRLLAGKHALWLITLIQGLLYVCTVYLAANLALKMTKLPQSKLFTALAMLPAISAAQYTTAILSETLFVFLLVLHLSIFLKYCQQPSTLTATWTALSFGLLVLTKPIVLMLWVAHLLLLLTYRLIRLRSKQAHQIQFYNWSHFAAATLALTILLTPWFARNHVLFGKASLTEFVGRNLWIVSFQGGSGAQLPIPVTTASNELESRTNIPLREVNRKSTWFISNQLTDSGLNDAQVDRLMKQVCWDAIKVNQLPFLKKTLRRCFNYWRCAHTDLLIQGGEQSKFVPQYVWQNPSRSIEQLLGFRFSQSVIGNTLLTLSLGLSLTLLFRNHSTRPTAVWIGMILSYFAIITGIFEIPDYRYRLVLEPIVGCTFGSALSVIFSKRELTVSLADE